MLDYRIHTFLTLCETMHYRRTAEALRMTQPAVTQHIHSLEKEYGVRLFLYEGRTLRKTAAAQELERSARTMLYQEQQLRWRLTHPAPPPLRIGATKTIGEFVLAPQLIRYLQSPDAGLTLRVDNTEVLLGLLDRGEVDFALIEGFFDRALYGWKLFREEAFVGICAAEHPFAGRSVSMEELLQQTLILREPGSGTRAIFEQLLHERSESTERFRRSICVSDFQVICRLVAAQIGVSFVYQAVADSSPDLATFQLAGSSATRQFNYVFLPGSGAEEKIAALECI